jgi:hypothetical protein
LTRLTQLLEVIQASSHDNCSGTTNKTSDEITRKTRNEMRQERTHTWSPGISPELKYLQDLSNRVNPDVIEEIVHLAGL